MGAFFGSINNILVSYVFWKFNYKNISGTLL